MRSLGAPGPLTVARERPVDALILVGMAVITFLRPIVGLRAIVLLAAALAIAVVLSSVRRVVGRYT